MPVRVDRIRTAPRRPGGAGVDGSTGNAPTMEAIIQSS